MSLSKPKREYTARLENERKKPGPKQTSKSTLLKGDVKKITVSIDMGYYNLIKGIADQNGMKIYRVLEKIIEEWKELKDKKET